LQFSPCQPASEPRNDDKPTVPEEKPLKPRR
jgi:hypothetical protein